MQVKDQLITEDFAIYNADCMDVVRKLSAESIDLSIYSPPFAGLYNYSSSERDFSNCESKDQFLEQYEFLIKEMSRITKRGRITAVHCADVHDNTCRLWDFPHEIIRLHEKHGFEYRNRITIWKEPLKVRMRTMVQSLMHKFVIEDSTKCFTAMPDYVLIFTKRGENKIPVTHPFGLTHYAGETPFLKAHEETYGNYDLFRERWIKFKGDIRSNKLSHLTWQRYASAVWDDIRIDNVLPFRESRENEDEKHVHPLQLDVIDRLVELYSNPGEVAFTPFMGVGSEVYSAVSLGRKAIGVELKESYFRQASMNCSHAGGRYNIKAKQMSLFNDD
jgi:DNA modification methylase